MFFFIIQKCTKTQWIVGCLRLIGTRSGSFYFQEATFTSILHYSLCSAGELCWKSNNWSLKICKQQKNERVCFGIKLMLTGCDWTLTIEADVLFYVVVSLNLYFSTHTLTTRCLLPAVCFLQWCRPEVQEVQPSGLCCTNFTTYSRVCLPWARARHSCYFLSF